MRLKSNKWNFVEAHIKLCSLESLVPFVVKKKDMELDEIKYLYLLFILPLLVVLFFSIPIGK
jgi:hypothetical protein